MAAKKGLFILAAFAILLVGVIAGFNYSVDPLCYYCAEIQADKVTVNRYYQVAQMILKNPDTQQVLLGSSRGETTSPLWIQRVSGLKTLNLSAAGAEVITKDAFLNIALENTHLKRVIWYADYFELISSNADNKIKNTKAFKKYTQALNLTPQGFTEKTHELQQLIDHNTIEASFAALKRKQDGGLGQGTGSEIDYSYCQTPEYKGKETDESLRHEVDLIYEAYVNGSIKPPQNPDALVSFQRLIQKLQERHVEVLIVIPPYHPTFMNRLKSEHSDIYDAHLKWIESIERLQGSGVIVKNYFSGIPLDNGSPVYWNDGVHFTCKGVMAMLESSLK